MRRPRLIPKAIRRMGPKTLQARLTLGFASVVGLTLLLVTIFVLNRLDDEFRTQQLADLEVRAELVAEYVENPGDDCSGSLILARRRFEVNHPTTIGSDRREDDVLAG